MYSSFFSLNSLFFTFRNQAYATGVATFSATESCCYNLAEYFFRIGSKTLPYKPPNTYPEMFSEMLRAIGSVGDVNMESNISYSSYVKIVPDAKFPGTMGMTAKQHSNVSSGLVCCNCFLI